MGRHVPTGKITSRLRCEIPSGRLRLDGRTGRRHVRKAVARTRGAQRRTSGGQTILLWEKKGGINLNSLTKNFDPKS